MELGVADYGVSGPKTQRGLVANNQPRLNRMRLLRYEVGDSVPKLEVALAALLTIDVNDTDCYDPSAGDYLSLIHI